MTNNDIGGKYGPLQVLKSNAGYYIGRIFHNDEGYDEPGSRESDYYETKEEAQYDLENNCFDFRDCPENIMLYSEYNKYIQ